MQKKDFGKEAIRLLMDGNIEDAGVLLWLNAKQHPSYKAYHNLGIYLQEWHLYWPLGKNRYFSVPKDESRHALKYLLKAQKMNDSSWINDTAIANTYYSLKNYPTALYYYQKAIEHSDFPGFSFSKKAICLLACHSFTKAKTDFETATESDYNQQQKCYYTYLSVLCDIFSHQNNWNSYERYLHYLNILHENSSSGLSESRILCIDPSILFVDSIDIACYYEDWDEIKNHKDRYNSQLLSKRNKEAIQMIQSSAMNIVKTDCWKKEIENELYDEYCDGGYNLWKDMNYYE